MVVCCRHLLTVSMLCILQLAGLDPILKLSTQIVYSNSPIISHSILGLIVTPSEVLAIRRGDEQYVFCFSGLLKLPRRLFEGVWGRRILALVSPLFREFPRKR